MDMQVLYVRMITRLNTLSLGLLYSMTFVACAMIGSLFFFVVFSRIERERAFLERGIKEHIRTEIELISAKKNQEKLSNLYLAKKHMFLELSKPYVNGLHMRSIIFKALDACELSMTAYEPQGSKHKEWYTKTACTISFNGSHEHIMRFFDFFNQHKHLITCKSMHMQASDNNMLKATCKFKMVSVKTDSQDL